MCASIQDSSLINWSKLCFDHSWQVEQPVLSECCRIKMSGDQLAPPAPLLCCNARWWQWLVLASGPWAARGVFVIFNQERWQLQSNVESSKDVLNRLRGMAWKSEVEKDWSWWKCHIFSLREKAWHWEDLRLRGMPNMKQVLQGRDTIDKVLEEAPHLKADYQFYNFLQF